MSRVLHRPGMAAAPRVVAPVEPALDPVLRELVDRAAAAAYERGLVDGRHAGREDGRRELADLGSALTRSIGELVAAVRAMKVEQAHGTVELATAIAAHVLDREPGDGAQALLARIRAWLAEVDDRPLRVGVNPADAAVVAGALAGQDGVEVLPDPQLAVGEARLTGAWSAAELLRAARWEQVHAALAGTSAGDEGVGRG